MAAQQRCRSTAAPQSPISSPCWYDVRSDDPCGLLWAPPCVSNDATVVSSPCWYDVRSDDPCGLLWALPCVSNDATVAVQQVKAQAGELFLYFHGCYS
jgi:hypothetical protein